MNIYSYTLHGTVATSIHYFFNIQEFTAPTETRIGLMSLSGTLLPILAYFTIVSHSQTTSSRRALSCTDKRPRKDNALREKSSLANFAIAI